MLRMSTTAPVVQFDKGWLKEWAPLNVHSIFSTCEVFQFPTDWLKEVALKNIREILLSFSVLK